MSFDVELNGIAYNHDEFCELQRNGGMTCGHCDTPYCYCIARTLVKNMAQSELHALGRGIAAVHLHNDFGYDGPMDKWPDTEEFINSPVGLFSAFANSPEELARMIANGELQMLDLNQLETLLGDGD